MIPGLSSVFGGGQGGNGQVNLLLEIKIAESSGNRFYNLHQVSDQESMKRLKRLMTIMDSMNDKVK